MTCTNTPLRSETFITNHAEEYGRLAGTVERVVEIREVGRKSDDTAAAYAALGKAVDELAAAGQRLAK